MHIRFMNTQKMSIADARSALNASQAKAASQLQQLGSKHFDVVIIGAGITGAQAAYNLVSLPEPPASVLLLDSGELGAGSHDRMKTHSQVPLKSAEPYKPANQGLGDETVYHPGNSGGVLFSAPHFSNGPTKLKFMVQLYPTTTPTFIEHHGRDGTSRYLRAAALGIELQKSLAKKLFGSDVGSVMDERGSVLVAEAENAADLEHEYELLRSLGVDDIELWDESKLAVEHGSLSGFKRGIFFPKEARIDALAFVNKVVAVGQQLSQGRLTVIEHCPAVISVEDVSAPASGVCITLRDGTRITANHAVVATNGMFLNSHLAGILRPCWSYFLTLPHPRDPSRGSQRLSELPKPALLGGHSSRNFFTFGFTHDWCVTDGAYRISGADHFSALKPPRSLPRCQALADWTFQHYPHMRSMVSDLPDTSRVDPASTKWLQGRYVYGVYGETPDYMPLLGKADAGSRIVYALGCNAWGQASLTFAASVVPGLLGFAVLTKEQAECADAMALSRFKTLPAYLNKSVQSKL